MSNPFFCARVIKTLILAICIWDRQVIAVCGHNQQTSVYSCRCLTGVLQGMRIEQAFGWSPRCLLRENTWCHHAHGEKIKDVALDPLDPWQNGSKRQYALANDISGMTGSGSIRDADATSTTAVSLASHLTCPKNMFKVREACFRVQFQ